MAMSTTKSLKWHPESGLTLINTPILTTPSGPNQVIIKVAYAGVCGTDLHIMTGVHPAAKGIILGHETSGVVKAIGKNVTSCAVGDHIAVKVNSHCGKCRFCLRGKVNFCTDNPTIGIFRDGGWAEFCEVPGDQVFKLPKGVSLKQGALVEPYSCITNGYDRCGNITDDSQILVMGAGIIGLLWSCMLHHKGYRDVTVAEISEERRKIASGLGLGYRVHHPDEVKEKMDSLNPDMDGFDLIIDTTGNAKAAELAFTWLCRGATYNVFGVCHKDAKMEIRPVDFFHKEITMTGTFIDPFTFPKTLSLIHNLSDKYLNYEKLGIKTYKLEEAIIAFDELKSTKIAKAVFEIGGEM